MLSEQFDVSAVWAPGRSPDVWLRVATMATLEVRSSSPRCSLASCFRSTMRSSRSWANRCETPRRVDKLGATGSSPVPPT